MDSIVIYPACGLAMRGYKSRRFDSEKESCEWSGTWTWTGVGGVRFVGRGEDLYRLAWLILVSVDVAKVPN